MVESPPEVPGRAGVAGPGPPDRTDPAPAKPTAAGVASGPFERPDLPDWLAIEPEALTSLLSFRRLAGTWDLVVLVVLVACPFLATTVLLTLSRLVIGVLNGGVVMLDGDRTSSAICGKLRIKNQVRFCAVHDEIGLIFRLDTEDSDPVGSGVQQ